jgi:hypothetical protein
MHLASTHVFPVKSLQGFSLDSVLIDHRGLAGDRRFLVVSESSGEFLTQRASPAMTQVTCLSEPDGSLTLRHRSGRSCSVHLPPTAAPTRSVRIWRDQVLATDCGDAVASFLSECLQAGVRLVHAGRAYQRPFTPPDRTTITAPDTLGFADAFPILVTSEGSLDALNDRLIQRGISPASMDRFRPNLVLRGCPAFAEEALGCFRIGRVTFQSAGPCGRCSIITTDQVTGDRTPEILSTLAEFRGDPHKPQQVNFGIHAVVISEPGTCSVGDPVIRLD